MTAQSLSIVVPANECINDCAFCVSHMQNVVYKNQMDDSEPHYDLYLKDYIKRLEYARDNGVNTVMLTGAAEPQQNRKFLTYFGLLMMLMERPFRNIEMQTTGVLLDEPYLRSLRNHVGVNTISLSLSSFDNEQNAIYNGTKQPLKIDIQQLCKKIKQYDFNLRLSLNMTDAFEQQSTEDIFGYSRKILLADQITFRLLYKTPDDKTRQSQWVSTHALSTSRRTEIRQYIQENGRQLEQLPFGMMRHSVQGMSTVLDTDCMNQSANESYRYMILRPDCKLYSKWDDPASLIF
jgi:hypothetical protein